VIARRAWACALLGALALLVYLLPFRSALVEVAFTANKPGTLRVYWADAGQSFDERRHSEISYQAGEQSQWVVIARPRSGTSLRLDLSAERGKVVLHGFRVYRLLSRPVEIRTGDDAFTALEPGGDVVRHAWRPEGLFLRSTGADPWVRVPPLDFGSSRLADPLFWTLVLLGSVLLVFVTFAPEAPARWFRRLGFVPVAMCVILGGQAWIAISSPQHGHPDERVHVAAAQYFETGWLIPRADDPAIRDTYSPYGISRLNSGEAAYWFAGKFSRSLQALGLEGSHTRLRLFNVMLFAILAALAAGSLTLRLLLLPMLVTPQAWYLFSYFNSDAFALFVAYVLTWQLVAPGSRLRRAAGLNRRGRWLPAFAGGFALVALASLSKQNFLIVPAFLAAVAGLLAVTTTRWRRPGVFAALLAGLAIAIAVPAAVNFAADARHGFEREAVIDRMWRDTARHDLGPLAPLDERMSTLNLRERGVSLTEMFSRYRWHRLMVQTGLGSYGYFDKQSSSRYYSLAAIPVALFLLFLFVPACWRAGWRTGLVLLGGLAATVTLAGFALWYSWLHDFQAQGRYLAPILPILGYLAFVGRRKLWWPGFGAALAAALVFALYSFFGVAVPG